MSSGAAPDEVVGRWVPAVADEVRPGDKIRRGDQERRVVNRGYPPVYQPMFWIEHEGGREGVSKILKLEIWDADGSVVQRVTDLRPWAVGS